VLRPASVLTVVLLVGLPSFGTLYTPASAALSEGADHRGLNQGLAFGLANFAWAAGMAIAAAASGAVAQTHLGHRFPTPSWPGSAWPR